MTIPNGHCERARAWVSLHADGELSELEHALLDAHLERCADCRAFAAGIEGLEALLRSTPLERPAHPAGVRQLRSSRSQRILQAGAAVAVIATGGLAAVLVGVFHATSDATTAPRIEHVSAIGGDPSTMRDLRGAYLVTDLRRPAKHILYP